MNQSQNPNWYQVDLHSLDVMFLVDKSTSMSWTDGIKTGQSRWKYAEELIEGFVRELGAYDDDGIDLAFFNGQFETAEGVTPESFRDVWKAQTPKGGTNLAGPLQWALDKAASRWREKPQLIVVFTDGDPSDKEQIAQIIIKTTHKMDKDEQCAILFAQVGDDANAEAFLAKLDDDLEKAGAKFDIVDAGPVEEVCEGNIQDVVNKAFND
jgi:hypothetical protein